MLRHGQHEFVWCILVGSIRHSPHGRLLQCFYEVTRLADDSHCGVWLASSSAWPWSALGPGWFAAMRQLRAVEASIVEAEKTESPPVLHVKVVRARSGGIPRTIQQPATMHAFESVDLYAMISGYLKSQTVDIGSRVKRGEVLAEINVPRDTKARDEAAALRAAGEGTGPSGRGPN